MGIFGVRLIAATIVSIEMLASQAEQASASSARPASVTSTAKQAAAAAAEQAAPPRRAHVLRIKDAARPGGVLKVVRIGRTAGKAGKKPAAGHAAAASTGPVTPRPASGNGTTCGVIRQ